MNYSFAKTKEVNKNSFKNLHLNNLNKSTLSLIRDKTPKNLGNNFLNSNKYIKPNIKNIKKNYGINVKYIENGKLKKIYNNKNKFDCIIQQKNVLKYFKIQKKTKSFIKNKEDKINNNISFNNNTNSNNKNLKLNIDINDNILLKEKIFNKINKSKENILYLNTDYLNKSSNINLQNEFHEKNIFNKKITFYNNYNKKNNILIKDNNNITFDGYNKRIPIKVNLKNNFERKKQALNDKNIVKETLNYNNKGFFKYKNYNNDIFSNKIFLNNSNID